MQATRKLILQYLKEHGHATVDELAEVLRLTTVTVRHHLDILRGEELVGEPVIRHRSSPGRPQYAYSLTEKASEHFPKSYCDLAARVLEEMKATTPPHQVNVFFEGVAQRLSAQAPEPVPGESLDERFDRAVDYLNRLNYVASWERTPEGYLLHTHNCPYESLAPGNPELCGMDMTLISNLLGTIPQRVSRVVEGAARCSYLIPASEVESFTGQPEPALE